MPHRQDPHIKKAKNIAAIVYLLILAFLVGGSYLDQQREAARGAAAKTQAESDAAPARN